MRYEPAAADPRDAGRAAGGPSPGPSPNPGGGVARSAGVEAACGTARRSRHTHPSVIPAQAGMRRRGSRVERRDVASTGWPSDTPRPVIPRSEATRDLAGAGWWRGTPSRCRGRSGTRRGRGPGPPLPLTPFPPGGGGTRAEGSDAPKSRHPPSPIGSRRLRRGRCNVAESSEATRDLAEAGWWRGSRVERVQGRCRRSGTDGGDRRTKGGDGRNDPKAGAERS
jgi:hypothetical protein